MLDLYKTMCYYSCLLSARPDGSQRGTRGLFSPATWILRTELRLSVLVAPLYAEPPCQTPRNFFKDNKTASLCTAVWEMPGALGQIGQIGNESTRGPSANPFPASSKCSRAQKSSDSSMPCGLGHILLAPLLFSGIEGQKTIAMI